MKSNFPEPVLGWLGVHEGGYVDHPQDPGGRTNKGVTQAVYDHYRQSQGLPVRSVWHLTGEEHHRIYRTRYWARVKGDQLPPGVDYCVFDAAVNSGVSQAAKWLQRAVGVRDDGVIGPVTLEAVNASDPLRVVESVCDQRLNMLRRLKTWPTFGKGWSRRVEDVRRNSRGMVAPVRAPMPEPKPDISPKPSLIASVLAWLAALFGR